MPTQSIPQMIAAHNREVRMNRRLTRIGMALSTTVMILAVFAVSMGVITLAAQITAASVSIDVMGGAQ